MTDDAEAIIGRGIIHMDLREESALPLVAPPEQIAVRGVRHPPSPTTDDAIVASYGSFDFLGSDGADVTIAKGRVRYHGRGKYACAEGDVTITGGTSDDPQWVSVRMQLQPSLGTPALVVTDTEPETDNSYFYKPLYTFYLSGDAAVLEHDWRHDVDIMAPIA